MVKQKIEHIISSLAFPIGLRSTTREYFQKALKKGILPSGNKMEATPHYRIHPEFAKNAPEFVDNLSARINETLGWWFLHVTQKLKEEGIDPEKLNRLPERLYPTTIFFIYPNAKRPLKRLFSKKTFGGDSAMGLFPEAEFDRPIGSKQLLFAVTITPEEHRTAVKEALKKQKEFLKIKRVTKTYGVWEVEGSYAGYYAQEVEKIIRHKILQKLHRDFPALKRRFAKFPKKKVTEPSEYVRYYTDMLRSPYPTSRSIAADRIGILKNKKFTPLLIRKLSEETNSQVRESIYRGLSHLRDVNAVTAIMREIKKDPIIDIAGRENLAHFYGLLALREIGDRKALKTFKDTILEHPKIPGRLIYGNLSVACDGMLRVGGRKALEKVLQKVQEDWKREFIVRFFIRPGVNQSSNST